MIAASVVIPTRNRARLLSRCLESLTRQTLHSGSFEVIVVDNDSTDDTRATAESYSRRLNLRYVYAPEPGLHVGRHAGYRAAVSDVLMYADDDIEAEPTWVEAVIQAFTDPRVTLVGGNNLPRFEIELPPWLKLWWTTPTPIGLALGYLSILDLGSGRFPIDPSYVWGCNFSVRRNIVAAAGGFHPDSFPADRLKWRGDGETPVAKFARGNGGVVLFDSKASVHHFVPSARMTAEFFVNRAYAQGISDSYSESRRSKRFGGVTRRALVRLKPFIGQFQDRWRTRALRGLVGYGEMLDVRLRARASWMEGYSFHQEALREDPSLVDWVMKRSYM